MGQTYKAAPKDEEDDKVKKVKEAATKGPPDLQKGLGNAAVAVTVDAEPEKLKKKEETPLLDQVEEKPTLKKHEKQIVERLQGGESVKVAYHELHHRDPEFAEVSFKDFQRYWDHLELTSGASEEESETESDEAMTEVAAESEEAAAGIVEAVEEEGTEEAAEEVAEVVAEDEEAAEEVIAAAEDEGQEEEAAELAVAVAEEAPEIVEDEEVAAEVAEAVEEAPETLEDQDEQVIAEVVEARPEVLEEEEVAEVVEEEAEETPEVDEALAEVAAEEEEVADILVEDEIAEEEEEA
jgi:hypothetical protein